MIVRSVTGAFALVSFLLASTALADSSGRPLQIVVSKDTQSLTVYDGSKVVSTSRVSTGKAGHSTPTGIFSILEKRKYHESNIYSNSPMPFMQRLTWSGIALHESKHVPAYPASHGCVRLPAAFAKSLFGMTERGVHVIISDRPVAPRPVYHTTLFQPFNPAPDPAMLLSDAQLRPATFVTGGAAVEVAMIEPQPDLSVVKRKSGEAPLKMLITRTGEREKMLDIQLGLNELGFDSGVPDGAMGSRTISAINDFKRVHSLAVTTRMVDDAFVSALYTALKREPPPAGHLMVRQNFRPLFEVPVDIRDPEIALGTHFFEAVDVDRDNSAANWNAISLDNDLSQAARKRLGITSSGNADDLNAAEDVLSRIVVPQEVRNRIGALLAVGSSLTISDAGHVGETGQGTDFITLTKSPQKRS